MFLKNESHLGNGEGRAPLFFQNVKANASVAVDIRVKHLRPKCNLWWFEWIVRREVNGNEKHTA